GLKRIVLVELIVGIFIMGSSVYSSITNSETVEGINASKNKLQENVITLLQQRKSDSINKSTFQQYLKDSFDIERLGDKPVKVFYNTRNNYITNQQEQKGLPDSV